MLNSPANSFSNQKVSSFLTCKLSHLLRTLLLWGNWVHKEEYALKAVKGLIFYSFIKGRAHILSQEGGSQTKAHPNLSYFKTREGRKSQVQSEGFQGRYRAIPQSSCCPSRQSVTFFISKTKSFNNNPQKSQSQSGKADASSAWSFFFGLTKATLGRRGLTKRSLNWGNCK